MHFPLAFSIHHFVSSVGADAGFAAIVGLAILVLLYFAQARETSSLRDQSVSASERVAELERRLAQVGSAAVRAVGRQQAADRSSPQLIPAAPAGVGAPALAAATRVVPLPSPAAAPAPVAPSPLVAAPPPVVTPPPATVAASSGSGPAVATPAPIPAVPAPATSAASNGTGEHAVAPPTGSPPGGGGQPPRAQLRPGGGFESPPSPLRGGTRRPAPRRLLPPVVAVVLAAVAVAALLIVTSSGGSPHPAGAGKTTNAPTARHPVIFQPSSVTVAVLNGTDVNGLASRVALKLAQSGYKKGTVGNAADQTHTSTIVGYLPHHQLAARKVASALRLSAGVVSPADQSAQAVACPPPSACRADVIVTVGSDYPNTP